MSLSTRPREALEFSMMTAALKTYVGAVVLKNLLRLSSGWT